MKGYIPTATSYVHVLPVDDRTDMVDLQYWLFYPYNGQETFEVTGWTGSTGQALMPLSIHWGDWECVTVRVNIDQQVVGVFFSQHSGGQWCSPNDGFLSLSGTHPNVYVASGSHANYPAASNSTYEIGGVDVWDVRFAVADYARGGGPTVNLSAPNPPVVIQNDAQAILPTPVTSPPWLAFRGRWGQPIEPTLTDAEIGSLVAAAASGMQLNVLVEDAVQYVAGSTTLQAWLSEVILPIAKGDLTGPTGPSQKGSWAVTPTFLPLRHRRADRFERQSRSGGAGDDAGIANPLHRNGKSLAAGDACVEPQSGQMVQCEVAYHEPVRRTGRLRDALGRTGAARSGQDQPSRLHLVL